MPKVAKIVIGVIAAIVVFAFGAQSVNDDNARAEKALTRQEIVMTINWDQMTAWEQDEICTGWNSSEREHLLDVFMDSASDEFSREVAADFFDKECWL